MEIINFSNTTTGMHYDPKSRTSHVSEHLIRFATAYRVLNPKTGDYMDFNLSHSTGPEFDENTEWVYTHNTQGNAKGNVKPLHTECYFLRIKNDSDLTEKRKRNYLDFKMNN